MLNSVLPLELVQVRSKAKIVPLCSRCSFSMMVKWENDGKMFVNDYSPWWSNERTMAKCSFMMVKWVYDRTLISPSLTSILPSFAYLTIIEKLHRHLCTLIDLLSVFFFVHPRDLIGIHGYTIQTILNPLIRIKNKTHMWVKGSKNIFSVPSSKCRDSTSSMSSTRCQYEHGRIFFQFHICSKSGNTMLW